LRIQRRVLIGIGLTTILLASCTGGTPELVLGDTEVDLGEVVNGEVLTIEIPIQNTGDKELVIEAVTTSCGCTSAEVTPERIAPGGEGVLHIQYDSGAHGPEANGPVIRQIFIASNDPDQPEAEFRVLANVIPPES
jgi:hypothetical protein